MNRKFVLLAIIAVTFLSIIGVSVIAELDAKESIVQAQEIEILTENSETTNNGKKITITDFTPDNSKEKKIKILLEKGINKVNYVLKWRVYPDEAAEGPRDFSYIITESPLLNITKDIAPGTTDPITKKPAYYYMEIEIDYDIKSFNVTIFDKDNVVSSKITINIEIDDKKIEDPDILIK